MQEQVSGSKERVAIAIRVLHDDIYERPGKVLEYKDLEYEPKELKRCGRSWTGLARPSPLFVLVYSDLAEPIVYVYPTRLIDSS
jgi:hypothetical protein